MKIRRLALLCVCAAALGACVSSPAPDTRTRAVQEPPIAPAEPSVTELIERGDTAGLQALFKGRERVNVAGPDGRFPLHAAVAKGASDMVEILLAMGAEPDALDAEGKTPLRYAVDGKDAASAKALSRRGASLFMADGAGVSPLDAAIAKGFTASVVDKASIGARGPKGETALHVAVDRLSLEAVKAILALGPELGAKDAAGRTPLDAAFLHPGSTVGAEIAELLVARNAPSSIDEFAYFLRTVRDTNYARARFADGATALHEAVRYDHRGYLSFFLERGVPVDAKTASGSTPLHDAIRLGRLEAAALLLSGGADPNARDGAGNATLHIALPVSQGAVDLVLARGADPALKDKAGNTALHVAVSLGYAPAALGALIDKGAPIDSTNAEGDTPLAMAMRRKAANVVELLATRGASMFVRNAKGETPLSIALADGVELTRTLVAASPKGAKDDSGEGPFHYAVRMRAGSLIIETIKAIGLDPSARNNEGDGALHLAARTNSAAEGQALLLSGADPYAVNAAGVTPLSIALAHGAGPQPWFFSSVVLQSRDSAGNGPLHHAAMDGSAVGVAFLVKEGVPVDARNADGQTPLMLALRKDSTGTVNALLSLGADAGARDGSGATTLHLAVYWKARECLRLLARSAASLDQRDFTGKTPLRDAVDKADALATAFLLEGGADPLARDNSGKTPLHAAARQGDERFATALVAKAARVDIRDDAGATPLIEAAYAENVNAARVLTAGGASVHAKDASGESPLSYAAKKSPAMLKTLLSERTARTSDADGRSVVRVIIDAKPSVELLGIAMAAGASPHDRDAFGRSPLHVALASGQAELAQFLVSVGSDRFVRDATGTTPAGLAFSGGDALIAALFGADPSASDFLGETALHYAAAAGAERAVQSLLALGADTERRNAAGERPADVANRRGHQAIASMLGGK